MNPRALFSLSYGIYIVSTNKGTELNGQIANTAFQISSVPQTIAVSINKENLTHDFIEESGVFSISILSQKAPMEFIGKFGFKSGKDINKFAGVNYKNGILNEPIVTDYTIAYLECKIVSKFDVFTHTVYVGEIVNCDVIGEDEPMTYEYYHTVKKGTAPKSAPTYIDPKSLSKDTKSANKSVKYKCNICGYIYDPEEGDEESGVTKGTPFEKVPEDWLCPICSAGKDEFEKI